MKIRADSFNFGDLTSIDGFSEKLVDKMETLVPLETLPSDTHTHLQRVRDVVKKDLEWTDKFFSFVSEKKVDLRDKQVRGLMVADYLRFGQLSLFHDDLVPSMCIDFVFRAHLCLNKHSNEFWRNHTVVPTPKPTHIFPTHLPGIPPSAHAPPPPPFLHVPPGPPPSGPLPPGPPFFTPAPPFPFGYSQDAGVVTNRRLLYNSQHEERVLAQDAKLLSNTNLLFNEKNGREMNALLFLTETISLPKQDGLRKTLLKEIAKNFSASETLWCSLVCKEWLSICRSDRVWEEHLKRDSLEWRREFPNTFDSVKTKFSNHKSNFFFVYWTFKSQLKDTPYEYLPVAPKPVVMCGIAASVRKSDIVSGEALLEAEMSGDKECYFGAVYNVMEEIFSEKRVVELSLRKLKKECEVEKMKEELSREVSLLCVKEAMTEFQIRKQLLSLLQERLSANFDF